MAQLPLDLTLCWAEKIQRLSETTWPRALSAFGHVLFLTSALILCGSPSPVWADEVQISPLEAFQQKEDYLYRTGFRLARSNAMFCNHRENSLGLLIHDIRAYSHPEVVRSLFNLSGDIGVQSVAEHSPAEAAGLARNDTLISVNGVTLADLQAKEARDWTRASEIRDLLKTAAARSPVTLTWINGGGDTVEAKVESVAVCASTFELLSGDNDAAADGERVLVGEDFPGFSYPEEEFAAILAHEMAHNILGHLDTPKTKGKRGSRVRQPEREADRLMPWILANAGYDPAAAVRMMERWGPRHGGGLFRKRTHDGWDERREFIKAELPLIEKSIGMRPDNSADWLMQFDDKPPLEKSK